MQENYKNKSDPSLELHPLLGTLFMNKKSTRTQAEFNEFEPPR